MHSSSASTAQVPSLRTVAAQVFTEAKRAFLQKASGFTFHVDQTDDALFAVAVMDRTALFNQLVTDYHAPLYRFAQSLCRRQGMAEDLVQQTYLQWAKKGHQLIDSGKAKTWLFTTLYREWLGIARKEQRFQVVEFDAEIHGEADLPEDDPPAVSPAQLQAALDEMDVTYRAPLVLFYLKELSYREISETLDVPIGTVMSRLSRAKDALRKVLKRTTIVSIQEK